MNLKVIIVIISILMFNIFVLLIIDPSIVQNQYNYSPNGYLKFGYDQIIEGQNFECYLCYYIIGEDYTLIYETENFTIIYIINNTNDISKLIFYNIQYISEGYEYQVKLYENNIFIDYLRFEVIPLTDLLTQGD